jgi:pimeloyl-ACP methyl ester carboxylesterase/DNA-binding CsgD family transcriptional regulator
VTTTGAWKPRELEILALLAKGLTNNEIGLKLHLAPDTVRWYNKQLFAKLGVNSRGQAVNRAAELGLGERPAADAPQPPARLARPAVRYAVNGDIHLAYQVVGNGPIDLLFIHGFLSHVELAWDNAEFTQFFEHLGKHLRVILFDKRGMGLSDRPHAAPTLEETIADARCVLAAAGSQQTYVLGTSEGGAAAVLMAALHPEQVRGLILYAATPMVVQRNQEPAWAEPQEAFERMLAGMSGAWGGPWGVENFAPSRAQDEAFRAWWARVLRAASSPSAVRAVLSNQQALDIRPLLPQVHTRSLVMHKTADRMVSVEAGRYLADHLHNATWMELPGPDHIYFVESSALEAAIVEFCHAEAEATPTDSWLAIILCARTSLPSEVAAQMRRAGARQVVVQTNGALGLFDSPARALACARQLRGLGQTAGDAFSLHVGECRLVKGRPQGTALEAARQAAMLAARGEIVVTRTLRDILAGTDVRLAERPRPANGPGPTTLPVYTLLGD